MNTAVLAHPLGLIDSQSVGLIGLPAEKSAQRSLPGSAEKLLKSIAETLDAMILDVISKRTAGELRQAEDEVFPQYVSLVVAFARVASKLVDRKTIARLSRESFCELEAEIREDGEASFGEALRDRALSTVWMLRKISDLLEILQTAPVGPKDREKDAEFAEAFFLHAVRARFYIDCLMTSMRTKRPLYRDTFPQVDDGLRSIINAYAWVKQSLDLRLPNNEPEPEAPAWTEEDQALINASMADMDSLDSDD
jgi:hypothetical protein